jgi:hypothetical protein
MLCSNTIAAEGCGVAVANAVAIPATGESRLAEDPTSLRADMCWMYAMTTGTPLDRARWCIALLGA